MLYISLNYWDILQQKPFAFNIYCNPKTILNSDKACSNIPTLAQFTQRCPQCVRLFLCIHVCVLNTNKLSFTRRFSNIIENLRLQANRCVKCDYQNTFTAFSFSWFKGASGQNDTVNDGVVSYLIISTTIYPWKYPWFVECNFWSTI